MNRVQFPHQMDVDLLVFLLAMGAYTINRFILKKWVVIPMVAYILKCHFNDFCGSLAFLAYVNIVLSHSKYPDVQLQKYGSIFLVSIGISFCWEGIAPLISQKSTADWLDVLSYVLGGVAYWRIKQSASRSHCTALHRCKASILFHGKTMKEPCIAIIGKSKTQLKIGEINHE